MVQLPLFSPKADWRPPNLSELPSWKSAKRAALDIETHDPLLLKLGPGVRRGAKVVGISFALQFPDSKISRAYYLPIGHEGGDNLPREQVLVYLREQAEVFTGDIIVANGQYDLDFLAELKIIFRKARFIRDVQNAEPLLDENHFSYGLDSVLTRNGFEGKNESHLDQAAAMFNVDSKADLWKLPGRHVGPYAETDAARLIPLIEQQEARIRAIDEADGSGARLWDLYNLESRLMPVLIKMRRRGVRVDFLHLDRVEERARYEEEQSLKEVTRLSGVLVTVKDINRPSVVGKAIEAVIGNALPRTKNGQPSIAKEVLEGLGKHQIVEHFLRARRYNKLRTTFVESIREHAINGRVHCTFNQLRRQKEDGDSAGTITGRLSSGDPNLQQQPARDPEIGKMWRAIYLPEEGAEWACLDYSQQEPRWLVHFAEVSNCVGAREAADRYRSDPKTDNHTMMTEMIYGSEFDRRWLETDKQGNPLCDKALFKKAKKMRGDAKTIYLGLCYAMGGAKLCHSLGLGTAWITTRAGKDVEVAGPEGQALLDLFDSKVPFIKELARRAENRAKDRGFIKTILGRRCRFPLKKDGSNKYDFTHKALNKLIQGSSADQTKKAMVDADDAGIRLQLQVHDELDLSIWSRTEGEHLAEIMRNCVPCNVPARVDMEIGPNWGDIK